MKSFRKHSYRKVMRQAGGSPGSSSTAAAVTPGVGAADDRLPAPTQEQLEDAGVANKAVVATLTGVTGGTANDVTGSTAVGVTGSTANDVTGGTANGVIGGTANGVTGGTANGVTNGNQDSGGTANGVTNGNQDSGGTANSVTGGTANGGTDGTQDSGCTDGNQDSGGKAAAPQTVLAAEPVDAEDKTTADDFSYPTSPKSDGQVTPPTPATPASPQKLGDGWKVNIIEIATKGVMEEILVKVAAKAVAGDEGFGGEVVARLAALANPNELSYPPTPKTEGQVTPGSLAGTPVTPGTPITPGGYSDRASPVSPLPLIEDAEADYWGLDSVSTMQPWGDIAEEGESSKVVERRLVGSKCKMPVGDDAQESPQPAASAAVTSSLSTAAGKQPKSEDDIKTYAQKLPRFYAEDKVSRKESTAAAKVPRSNAGDKVSRKESRAEKDLRQLKEQAESWEKLKVFKGSGMPGDKYFVSDP